MKPKDEKQSLGHSPGEDHMSASIDKRDERQVR